MVFQKGEWSKRLETAEVAPSASPLEALFFGRDCKICKAGGQGSNLSVV
jgi:hypothetical protein